jgi:hypothetical protein
VIYCSHTVESFSKSLHRNGSIVFDRDRMRAILRFNSACDIIHLLNSMLIDFF